MFRAEDGTPKQPQHMEHTILCPPLHTAQLDRVYVT